MTDQEALRQQLQAMVCKAQRALKAAETHLAQGDPDFASSKAYYAVFHLMQAALLTQGKTYSKHAGVIRGFSEHFVRPGMFPSECGGAIQRLREGRGLGDYGYQLSVQPEDAAQDLQAATEISKYLTEYLQPFLSS